MKSDAQKRKEKAQQQFQSSAAKSRKPKDFFAASITPANINLAEKACNALLVNFQLQRQSFLGFAAAHLLNISSKNDIIWKATCINLENIQRHKRSLRCSRSAILLSEFRQLNVHGDVQCMGQLK